MGERCAPSLFPEYVDKKGFCCPGSSENRRKATTSDLGCNCERKVRLASTSLLLLTLRLQALQARKRNDDPRMPQPMLCEENISYIFLVTQGFDLVCCAMIASEHLATRGQDGRGNTQSEMTPLLGQRSGTNYGGRDCSSPHARPPPPDPPYTATCHSSSNHK
ncbi:hypothetical protein Pcinc_001861 [Petrolisthes cinctipes]|uniref:Uncharacterized protein n=1 Tax=Petrolisthes cinctipes TaxID=88211 RepID=A0AAE1GM72_PETCI|nr:hypothetical protein Pcinc_001861 [Petrolisthes cinctipes]